MMKYIVGTILTVVLLLCIYVSPFQIDQPIESKTMYSTDGAIVMMDDLVKFSEHVIIGEVKESNPFNDGIIKYLVKVVEEVKGNTNSYDIDLYTREKLVYESNYLLFLTARDSELYPRNAYSMLGPTYIEINGEDLVVHGEISIESIGRTELIDKLTKSKFIYFNVERSKAEKYEVIESIDDIDGLILRSDYIVKISPIQIIDENLYVKTAYIQLLEQYKGEKFDTGRTYALPSNVELGKEYLLFLKLQGEEEMNHITLTTRKGSIISNSNSTEWNKYTNIIQEQLK